MSGSSEEAIAQSNHASREEAFSALKARSEPDSRDRLSLCMLCVHGLLIGVSRWLKKKKKCIDVREAAILSSLFVIIVCVCSLPSVLYFALIVSSRTRLGES